MQGGRVVGTGARIEGSNGQGVRSDLPPGFLRNPVTALSAAIEHALEHRRGFLLFPFAAIAGLVCYRVLAVEPGLWAVLALAGAAVAWATVSRWRGNRGTLSWLALGLALGIALLPLHGAFFGTPMLAGAAYGTFQARVDEVLAATDEGQRVVVSSLVPVKARPVDVRRARLFLRTAPPLSPGDVIAGPLRLAEVPGPPVPGGFDSQFHAYFDGIGAYGSATGPVEIIAHEPAGLFGLVAGVRRAIGVRIDAALAGRQAAVARALVIGDQSRIDDETRRQLATAGIAHVLAISGLHLSLVAGAAFAAVRLLLAGSHRLAQRLPVKRLAAGAGLVVVFVYLAISGAGISATRASVMLSLIFLAVLFGRQALTMRNVAFAALFVLATEPAGLFRPGFQLSFAAVAALIGVYEQGGFAAAGPGGPVASIWRFFAGLVISSLVAGLATAVFAAYHFQQTAPLGLAGNLVALPLLGFLVLPSLMLGVLAMPLGLEAPFLAIAGWGIDQILAMAALVAEASRSIAIKPLLSPLVLVFALGAAAWFVFFTGKLRLVGPLAAAVLVGFFGFAPVPDVLVADRTQAVGLRAGNVLMLATGRKNSFATDVWAETYGFDVVQGGDSVACDALGCIGTLPDGARIAVDTDIAAFIEDCDGADLVVTRRMAPDWCRRTAAVIDAGDLARGGVTAAYWNAQARRFAVVPSIADTGRPWRISR